MKKLALLALLGGLAFGSPQPVQAGDFYIDVELGGLLPSDSDIQQVYGLMPRVAGGIGIESNGWGAEMGLVYAFQEGTAVASHTTPG